MGESRRLEQEISDLKAYLFLAHREGTARVPCTLELGSWYVLLPWACPYCREYVERLFPSGSYAFQDHTLVFLSGETVPVGNGKKISFPVLASLLRDVKGYEVQSCNRDSFSRSVV